MNCGYRFESTCNDCTDGNGAWMCDGDCIWSMGKCDLRHTRGTPLDDHDTEGLI